MAHLLIFQIFPACLVLGLVLWVAARRAPARVVALLGRRLWVALGALLLALYWVCVGCAAYLPVVIDQVESTVAATAALWLRGEPVYTTVDAAWRYSLLYGPLCYAPYTAGLWAFGPHMGVFKGVAVAVNVGLFVLLWRVFRTMLRGAESLLPLGFVAAGLMMKGMSTFLVRGDAALAGAVALAFLAVNLTRLPRRSPAGVSLFIVAGAVALDIKFTAAFWLLVPFYLLWQARGRWWAVGAACAIPLVAFVPFLLPTVPFRNYLGWIDEASKHAWSMRLFAMNAVEGAILLAPVAAMLWRFYKARPAEAREFLRRHWLLFAYLGISVMGGMVTGAKVGAGRSHLNPGFIVAGYVAVMLWAKVPAVEGAWLRYAATLYAVVLLLPAVSQTRDLWQIGVERRTYAVAVNADLDALLQANRGRTVEMGYSETPSPDTTVDSLALFSPRLVLAGQPNLVDAGALFDMQFSRLEIPSATFDALRGCAVQVWLFPRGTEPWQLSNAYAQDVPALFPDKHLFPAEWREAFAQRYRKTGSSKYYDLWSCR